MGYTGDNKKPKSAEKRGTSGGVWQQIFNRDPRKSFSCIESQLSTRAQKYQKEEKIPNKGWKFYKSMLFLKNKPKTSKVAFTSEEHEALTTFYQTNPALWNHGMTEYRDRNIRRALIQKLCEEFDGKFTENGLKKSGMFF